MRKVNRRRNTSNDKIGKKSGTVKSWPKYCCALLVSNFEYAAFAGSSQGGLFPFRDSKVRYAVHSDKRVRLCIDGWLHLPLPTFMPPRKTGMNL